MANTKRGAKLGPQLTSQAGRRGQDATQDDGFLLSGAVLFFDEVGLDLFYDPGDTQDRVDRVLVTGDDLAILDLHDAQVDGVLYVAGECCHLMGAEGRLRRPSRSCLKVQLVGSGRPSI